MTDLQGAVERFVEQSRRCGRAMIIFAVTIRHPKASGKKRAFLIRQARRNIRATRNKQQAKRAGQHGD